MRITVIVSHFNRPDGLRRALASVRAQTCFADLDVIVCDDHSRLDNLPMRDIDATGALLVRGRKFTPLQKATEVCTMGALINRGIWLGDAPLIAYITDDAEWKAGHLELLRAALVRHGDDAMAASSFPEMGTGWAGTELRSKSVHGALLSGLPIDRNHVLHRRRDFKSDWPTDPFYWHCADVQTWKRMTSDKRRDSAWLFTREVTVNVHTSADDIAACVVRGEDPVTIFERKAKA